VSNGQAKLKYFVSAASIIHSVALLNVDKPETGMLKPCLPGQKPYEAIKDGINLIIKGVCEEVQSPHNLPQVRMYPKKGIIYYLGGATF
jgi:hypothetical protein